MYHFALAWRYAHSRLVNYIAVAAVALCLAVQIVVMAVLDGMLEDMRCRVRDLGEQITISFLDRELLVAKPTGGLPTLADLEAAEAVVRREIPEVLGITPLLRGYGVIERRGDFLPTIVFGIDLARETRYSRLAHHLQAGKVDSLSPSWFSAQAADNGLPPIFVGAELADRLGITIGEEVAVGYAAGEKKEMTRRTFLVANTFRSGSPWKDDAAVYIPLAAAQEMFLAASAKVILAPIFSVWLADPDRANELEDRVRETVCRALGRQDGRSYNWQKGWRRLSEGMEYENNLQEIVLALMNLSGGFCVFAILATLVSRRVRDVGLLRCLGASRCGVGLVFILVGFFLGLAGTAIGTATGYILAEPGLFFSDERPLIDWLFERFTGHPLYPVRMFEIAGFRPIFGLKVIYYAVGALAVSLLAALYPAVWAGLRQPIQSLREE